MSTLQAQLCSPEEQVVSGRGNAPLHCLTRNQSIVLAVRAYAVIHARCLTFEFAAQFVAQSGALSLTACVVTFALILASTHTLPLPTSS